MTQVHLETKFVKEEAKKFAEIESNFENSFLYGITDGKAIGTYLEQKFLAHLSENYLFSKGSSANGLDIPGLDIDIKVTSIKQPQSSCPFRSARQKIYGLGYGLLLFVYDKIDDSKLKISKLNIVHSVFIDKTRTADFQLTKLILESIKNGANSEDLIALFFDRNLPIEEIEAVKIADDILKTPPVQGFLTISNALQWRIQYARVVDVAGSVLGIDRLFSGGMNIVE